MSSVFSLAWSELLMLARNRTAAATAIALPLVGGLWIINETPSETPLGSTGALAAFQVLFVLGLTVVGTMITTLVGRRQQHLLERWRTTGTADYQILLGTVAPACALLVVQAAILLTATAIATGDGPANPFLVALGVLLGGGLGCAAAFLVAALTRTVEAANVTLVIPVLALLGGGLWALSRDPDSITWAIRATGGGAIVEVVQLGWSGSGTAADALAGLAALVVLATVISALAAMTFRWSPRR